MQVSIYCTCPITDTCFTSAQALLVLDNLIKNGSERVIENGRERVYDLRSLESYRYVDENQKDQGINGTCSSYVQSGHIACMQLPYMRIFVTAIQSNNCRFSLRSASEGQGCARITSGLCFLPPPASNVCSPYR